MKTIVLRRKKSTAKGCGGAYYKLSGGKGVKVLWCLEDGYSTKKELLNSDDYIYADEEADNLKAARRSGVAPRCFGVVAVKQENRYYAGILMQHIEGKHPNWSEYPEAEDAVQRALENVNMWHEDMHSHNVLVKRMRGRKKYYAVDFECVQYISD